MLNRNLIEEELSLAYLHVISSEKGFSVDVPSIDRISVDAQIRAAGNLGVEAFQSCPQLDVQLKATQNWHEQDGRISFALPIKNYNDLRNNNVFIPRILVLLCLPAERSHWVAHSASELALKKCAYWLSLKGEPESDNQSTKTVYFPIENILSPEALHAIMIKVANRDRL